MSLLQCFWALKTGHQMRQCHSSNCHVCGSKHHFVLHLGNSAPTSQHKRSQAEETLGSDPHNAEEDFSFPRTSAAVLAQDLGKDVVLLANVLVTNRTRIFVPWRALLYSGSQLHLIISRFANQLHIKRTKSAACVTEIVHFSFEADGSQ